MTNITITSRENGLETIEEAILQLPALKRPTLDEIRADGRRIDEIERDNSTEEPTTITVVTVFYKPGGFVTNMSVRTEERLGYQHRRWLWEHRNEYPEFIARLKKLGVTGICFSGIILKLYDGFRWTRRIPAIYHQMYGDHAWEPGDVVLAD
jgi:hypothetical protein